MMGRSRGCRRLVLRIEGAPTRDSQPNSPTENSRLVDENTQFTIYELRAPISCFHRGYARVFNNETAVLGLRDTIRELKEHHPAYADRITQREWYAEVRFLNFSGCGLVGPEATDLSTFRITPATVDTNSHGYWCPPFEIREHIKKIAAEEIGRLNKVEEPRRNKNFAHFHSEFPEELGECEINDTVRISSFGDGALSVVKATYLDQLGTNITADQKIRCLNEKYRDKTLRALDTQPNGALKSFAECLQANTIGVAAIAVDCDGELFFPLRSFNDKNVGKNHVLRRLGAMERGWHCFSSGVLEWSDVETAVAQNDMKLFLEGLTSGILREILYETGLTREEHGFDIIPFAMARELKRPGKPQFFFLLRFNKLTAKEVVDKINEQLNGSKIRELTEYALERPGFAKSKFLNKLLNRPSTLKRHIWTAKASTRPLTDKFLFSLSEHGHAGEYPTYELFGGLRILKDATDKGHKFSWTAI